MKEVLITAALIFTSGLAAAQSQTSITSPPQVAPPAGADPSTAKSDVYTADRPDSVVLPNRADRRAKETGVATGFIAAGVGLALMGLFVRRRH